MFTATLPRINFKAPALEDGRVELARRAQAELGYNKLALALATPGALLFALRKLGIEPFTPSSVAKYKASKERQGMYSGTKAILGWLCSLIASFGVFVGGMSGGHDSNVIWSPLHYGLNTVSLMCGFVCLFGTLAYVFDDDWQHGTRTIRTWEQCHLRNYDGNVPEFALDRALRIMEACPTAQLYVDALIEKQDHREKPLRDPFLFVRLDAEVYYVDVWNEKEYEAKL